MSRPTTEGEEQKKVVRLSPVKRWSVITFLSVLSLLVLTFILTETILQLFHFSYRQTISKGFVRSKYTIMCLGNSHTAGVGAPAGESYPDHLQRIFDEKYGKGVVKVFNKGKGSLTSSEALEDLESKLEFIKPNLVILQLGGANYKNLTGYQIKNRNGSIFWNYLYKSRTIKFVSNLFQFHHNNQLETRTSPFPAVSEDERVMLSDIKYQKAIAFTVKHFITSHIYKIKNDYYQRLQQKQKKELFEAITLFQQGISRFPHHYHNYFYLADIYLKLQRYEDSLSIIIQGLKQLPDVHLNGEDNPLYRWVFVNMFIFPDELVKKTKQLMEYEQKFRKANHIFMSNLTPEEIHKWVLDDLAIIIKKILAKNTKVIVQNYVPDTLKRLSPSQGSLELKMIAQKFNLPFVDQERYFLDLLKREVTPEKVYFQLMGKLDNHPNSYGYRLMANKLFEFIDQGHYLTSY